MLTHVDAFIIFILCILLFPAALFDSVHITLILCFITLYCFMIVVKNKQLLLFLGTLGMFICIVAPEMSPFLPFLSYTFLYRKHNTLPVIYVLPIANWIMVDYRLLKLLIFPLILLAFYLAYQTRTRNQLQQRLISSRDASMEQELLLKGKNRELLENQDNEIYIATLKERNRIAREIHDNVGHMLSRSILQVGAMLAICKDETLKTHLTTLKESLDAAMNSIRNSVHDLHDESVDLTHALNNLIDRFTFCEVQLDCDISKYIPKEVKYCFLAIIKEALNNTMKHSNATKVTITVKEHPAFYQLLVEDNGTSKSDKTVSNDTSGIGLSNMKERVDALHGIIHVNQENGFRIFVSIQK